MACAQDHVFPPPPFDAYRVHHCRYVFIRSPARCTTDQPVICIGVAFFDSAWSRSVYPSSLDRNVNSISSGVSTVLPLRADMHRHPLGRVFRYVSFTTTVGAVMNHFPSGPYRPDSRHLRQGPLRAVWHGLSLGSSGRRHRDLLCVLSM